MKTVTVDDYQRIRIPDAEPRSKFSYEVDASGVIHLKKLVTAEPRPIKARLIKKDGHLVGTTDRPITSEMVKEALADFP